MNDSTLPTVVSPPTAMQWPLNAMERMVLCRELATARLVPPAFQKSPADLFLVMNTCERFGFDLFLTIGECFVTQGKVGFSGKMAAAMINASGRLAERLSYTYTGEGDDRTITVSGRLHGESEPRTVEVRLGNVKTTNAQWTRQPDQQLGYSGARTWGRRHLSEVMLGMNFDDEVTDMVDVTPATPRVVISTQNLSTSTVAEPPEQEHEEPFKLPHPESDEHWRTWAQMFIAYVRASHSLAEVERWLQYNEATLLNMRETEPKMHRMLENAIEQQRARLGAVPAGAANDVD